MASTAVGKAIKKWVVICDKLDVVGQVVSKTAGCVLKITYKAGKPVFHVLYEGVKVLPKFFEAPVSGKLYSFIIPLPQVNLKGGIEAFKEAIAKGEVKVERVLDEADNVIVDEEGNILNKAITKEGEEVELLEKVNIKSDGLLTRLNNASFKVLKGKFDELDDVLKQEFLSDFIDASDDVLHKLQDENLVETWKSGARSNDLNVLREIAQKPNLRSEYNSKVEALAQKRQDLISQGKMKEEIAKELFENRRQLTIEYKKITPDDFMEWIFKRNELEYVATGTGDKWGMTWNGGLKKQLNKIGLTDMSQATQQQLNEIYDNIATSASKTFGENKIALGASFRDFFKNKISADEYKELEKLLLKYRM